MKQLTATDFNQTFVDDVLQRMDERWKFDCQQFICETAHFPVPSTRHTLSTLSNIYRRNKNTHGYVTSSVHLTRKEC